jgi:lipopolysaccharide export system permease protein
VRILDRYILVSFLKNYLISLLVLLGLYVVLHMLFQFDEVVEVGSVGQAAGQTTWQLIGSIADFYFHQAFLFFVQLSGVIPVVAAAFTLVRMSRFNELTAVLVAGVPLLRFVQWVIISGVILNVVLLPVVQEMIIPRLIPKLTRRIDDLKVGKVRSFEIKMMQDAEGNLLRAGRYYIPVDDQPARMEIVDILDRDADGSVVRHVAADEAQWMPDDKLWRLTGAVEITGLLPGQNRSPPRPVYHWSTTITPEEIALYRSGDYVDLLSTRQIDELLQRPKIYGTADLLRVKHFRWSQFLVNIVLLMLAIPCVAAREPGKLKQNMVWCIALVGACMAAVFVAQNLAGNPPPGIAWTANWPLYLAWLPIVPFALIAVVMLDRMKT